MSQLNVNIIKNRVGSNGPTISGNTTVSGILTATSFSGDGSGLTSLIISGDGNLTNLNVSGVSTFTGNTEFDGNVTIGGTLTYRDVTNIDAVGMITARKGVQILADGFTVTGVSTLSNGAFIPDNQYLNIGNDSDLRLYHTGTTSFIEDQGTGNFIIGSNGGTLKITKGADTENMAVFTPDGSAALYYDNVKKLETSTNGINVVGVVTATSLDVNGDTDISGTATLGGIDAVGVVTARTGIKVLADGINAVGVVTATSFAGNGANVTSIDAGNISSGIVTSARLGSGTANSTTFLNGHGQFAEAGGGAWELITSVTASGAAQADITGTSSTYNKYCLIGRNVRGSTGLDWLFSRWFDNGTLITSNYNVSWFTTVSNSPTTMNAENESDYFRPGRLGSGTNDRTDFLLWFNSTHDSSTSTFVFQFQSTSSNSSVTRLANGSGAVNTSFTNISGVRFYPGSGTITGTFDLYGIS